MVKLNGGLGTRMGCRGPKSAIEVRSDLTFLDLTVRHVEYLNTRWGVDVPLVLMDSFQTHEETVRIVRKYAEHNLTIHCFTQSSYPKLLRDSLTPLPTGPFSLETKDLWYPPGHGDIYRALYKSGVLDSLLREGKEWLFVSNVDNTGATVDLNLVYHLVNHDAEFCMEVTQKTRSDVHGGTLISYEGRPKLLEAAQVPAEHEPEFRSLKRFTAFNTNNLWVSARAIKRLVEADAIRSAVVVNFREWAGRAIVELESAAGGAIEVRAARRAKSELGSACFFWCGWWVVGGDESSRLRSLAPCFVARSLLPASSPWLTILLCCCCVCLRLLFFFVVVLQCFGKAIGVEVDRSRFLPVKSTSDLLAIQSDLYTVRHGALEANPAREVPTPPVIKLGPEFHLLSDYSVRFAAGIPNMLELDHLTISGDVYFGRGVTLRGTVIIVANEGSRIDIPDGAVLENKVVTGHLRILEH